MDEQTYLKVALIALGVLVVLFFILRELFCWYWKINARIKLQKRTNFLLEKMYLLNGGKLSDISNDESNEEIKDKSNNETFGQLNDKEKEIFNLLSDQEKMEVNTLIRFGIKNGGRIAVNKDSRKIEKFDLKSWEKIKIDNLVDQWMIVFEKN